MWYLVNVWYGAQQVVNWWKCIVVDHIMKFSTMLGKKKTLFHFSVVVFHKEKPCITQCRKNQYILPVLMLSEVCALSVSTAWISFSRYLMCWDISLTRMNCSSSKRCSSIAWSKTDLFNRKVLPKVEERKGRKPIIIYTQYTLYIL